MCCKLLGVAELDKPRLRWCQHCAVGVGCRVYPERPQSCRTFMCGYLTGRDIGEHWRPTRSKMVLSYEEAANRLAIFVDPGRVDAWRQEPYYGEILRWAAEAPDLHRQIIVWEGGDAIAILPDGEQRLGPVREDQFIVTADRTGPAGREWEVMILDEGDPRLARLSNR